MWDVKMNCIGISPKEFPAFGENCFWETSTNENSKGQDLADPKVTFLVIDD